MNSEIIILNKETFNQAMAQSMHSFSFFLSQIKESNNCDPHMPRNRDQ